MAEAVKFDTEGYPVPPRSFVNGIFKGGSEGHQLYVRIIKGHKGTPTPTSEGAYSNDEVWDLSRQLFEDESVRTVLVTFSSGQRLSEHAASTVASLCFLAVEAMITLGQDSVDARPGTWVRMDPGLAHSIVTKSPVVMLLVLLKGTGKK